MANSADLGTKHECPNCGIKYYDLGKSDPHCPKCGASVSGELPGEEQEAEADAPKEKTAKSGAKKKKKKTTKKAK